MSSLKWTSILKHFVNAHNVSLTLLTALLFIWSLQMSWYLLKIECVNGTECSFMSYHLSPVQAASLPLSIIIVGVGPAEFDGEYSILALGRYFFSISKWVNKLLFSIFNKRNISLKICHLIIMFWGFCWVFWGGQSRSSHEATLTFIMFVSTWRMYI